MTRKRGGPHRHRFRSATERQLIREPRDASRAAAVFSLSLLLTALLGAVQSLLIVIIIGEGQDADAFLAAYSLYLPLALLGASLRASLAPLLSSRESDAAFRGRTGELLGRIVGLALLLAGALTALAPLMGRLITRGLSDEAQWTTVLCLVLLAPAGLLHVWAAAVSAVLIMARRYMATGLMYVVSAGLALAASAFFLNLVGSPGAALGVLIGTAFLSAGHGIYLARHGITIHPSFKWLANRSSRALILHLMAGATLAVVSLVNLSIALTAVSNDPGAITVYSYAFFLISLMLSVSFLPLGIVSLPDAVDSLTKGVVDGAEKYFTSVARHALSQLVPIVVAFAVFGPLLLEALFAGFLTEGSRRLLYELTLILAGFAVAAGLMFLAGNVILARSQPRSLLFCGLASVTLQLALVLALTQGGVTLTAAAHVVASVLAAILLLWVAFPRVWLRLVFDAFRGSLPAVAISIIFPLLRWPLGPDPALVVVFGALAAGGGLYVGLMLLVGRSAES